MVEADNRNLNKLMQSESGFEMLETTYATDQGLRGHAGPSKSQAGIFGNARHLQRSLHCRPGFGASAPTEAVEFVDEQLQKPADCWSGRFGALRSFAQSLKQNPGVYVLGRRTTFSQ